MTGYLSEGQTIVQGKGMKLNSIVKNCEQFYTESKNKLSQ